MSDLSSRIFCFILFCKGNENNKKVISNHVSKYVCDNFTSVQVTLLCLTSFFDAEFDELHLQCVK